MDKMERDRSALQADHPADDEPRTSEPTRSDTGTRPKPDKGDPPGQGKPAGQDGTGEGAKKKGSKLPLVILGIVAVLCLIAGGIWWLLHRDQTDTDDAYTDGRVVMMASQVDGYVTALAVTDNQFVHRGDLLVQIDARSYQAARDQAQGELATAEAQLANAQIALEKARTTFPAQLAQAQGQLVQAQGTLTNAQSDYKRQHGIERGATTQQNVDLSTASLRTAQGQVAVAQAQVDIANQIPQDLQQAAAQVRQLEGQVTQARAKLATADVNLSFTRVTAPQDGWVTRRNVEQGNYLQPGQQIMALVMPDLWITANFKETQLARMKTGQEVDIEVDAYPSLKLKGHVDSIQLGSGSKFSAFPAENATGNFVKIVQRVPVKIVIDSGLDRDHPLPLGASVVPTVYLK